MDIKALLDLIKETDSIFFNESFRLDVRQKGDSDFVTRADLEVSEYLRKRLSELYPSIGFISEEDEWEERSREGAYWILDPIDGTTNFMHALPFCCIKICDSGYFIHFKRFKRERLAIDPPPFFSHLLLLHNFPILSKESV